MVCCRALWGWVSVAWGGVLAGLGGRAVDLRAGGVSLSLTFVGLGRGGRLGRPGVVSLSARANRVVYDRGLLREWYAAGPLGIEQGFTLARRPAGTSAPVTLTLGLAGSARARQIGSRLEFVARSGRVALRYAGLSAIDANGRQLQAALALRGDRLLVRVSDRGARYPLRIDPLIQQGSKLTGTDEEGPGNFGDSVALSADGNTALIGGPGDSEGNVGGVGAAWVFTRSGSTWTQQGPKLRESRTIGVIHPGLFGSPVVLSADGNTALIGCDGGGAVWVFTRSGSTWIQQGPPLYVRRAWDPDLRLRLHVALSADGNTALFGAPNNLDANYRVVGAAWVFTRSGSTWTQQGPQLTATDDRSRPFGSSVALSADGNTALIAGDSDPNYSFVGGRGCLRARGRPGPSRAPSSPPATRSGPATLATAWRCPLTATRP